ncbi:MAG: RNA pseudouridine synthase [Sphingobacteriales bacterium]|nr:RNA pseudouridine synthase [Sphingobacteriales bacterium]OJW38661.1 MAG: RNA pseudouridine synthase [Sphingobacteriales bacterium 46-32]
MKLTELIIQETANWVAINKPSGLLSIPDREGKEISLKQMLIEQYGSIFTVHRIDRDTSGLIIFARNEAAHKHLSQQFESRQTEKYYQGLVIGSVVPANGSIDAPIAEHPVQKGLMVIHRQGKDALTDYEVLRDFRLYSWMQFRIHTGRTHQIRVHMKQLGHPLVADELYGDGKPFLLSSIKPKFKLSKYELEERPILSRLALHAFSLRFTDVDGSMVSIEAPLPKDMRATLQQLEKRAVKK